MRFVTGIHAIAAGLLFAGVALAQDRATVKVGDMTVSYGDAGEGRPLVLVHGGGLTSRMWGNFADAAVAAGWRVLTPDTRNHGGTDNPSGTFGYDLLAADLAGFIEALNLKSPAVMGYSDGGIVVETFLLAHPDTASAAIIGGATHRIAADQRYMAGMQAFYGYSERGQLPDSALDALQANAPDFAKRLRGLHATEAEPERWRTLHQLTWPVWTTELVYPLERFAAVPTKTLVFLGEDDEFFAPADALALSEALPAGEVAILPAGRHTVFRERADTFSAIVLEFLGRATAQ
ncbi:MAG: alpha/beta fold hydrolase [Rhizobiaceae bacterium]